MFIVLFITLVYWSHYALTFILPVLTLAFISRFFFGPMTVGFITLYSISVLVMIISMVFQKLFIGKTYFLIWKFKEPYWENKKLNSLANKEIKFWKRMLLVFKPIIYPINKVFFKPIILLIYKVILITSKFFFNNWEKIITTIENFFGNAINLFWKFLGYLIIFIFSFSYVLSIIKWFLEDHNYFWYGFKELVWALLPILNIFYVLDWWIIIFSTVFSLIFSVINFIKS